MTTVSHFRPVFPMASHADLFPHPEPAFNASFMKRWNSQMVPSWRFYYFDLDRINRAIVKNHCSAVVPEEYIKVSEFIKVKLGELQRRIQHASRLVCQQTSLADFIEFEQKLDDISAGVCDLNFFHSLHTDALALLRQYVRPYLAENLNLVYSKHTFDQLVVDVCNLYDSVRSSRSLPESPPISPMSLTGETFVSRRSKAWWVHADNSVNLMMHLLKYLSLSTKVVEGEHDSISVRVTSVVLDNPTVAEEPKIIKVQWSNAEQEVMIKSMDSDDRTRSIRTKQKYLERWINKEWSLFNLMDKLRGQGHDMEAVEPNAKHIQDLLDSGSIPVLRTVCNRVTFQSVGYPNIKITMDSNLMIQREHLQDGNPWVMLVENEVEDPLESRKDNVVRFPFDVVKISFGEGDEDLPHWWHELIRSKLIQQVPDVHNGIEDLAGFIKHDISSLNAWVQRVQETADLKTSKANIPVTLTKIRERGSTVTSTSNDSEGSTVVSISDYRTTDNSGILKAKGSKTLYGAADLELGAHGAPKSQLISKNTPVFVPTAVYGTTLSIMLAILYLTTFLL